MQHNGWDHALKVTADGAGLVGHAGAILLRKAADQAGLTAQLSAAVRRKGTSPLFDRGIVLVALAAAIALGATSMSDIALLAHLAPVLGEAPSGPTVRRALDLAGTPAVLDRIARARARARAHAWDLIEKTAAGFPWLVIAGKALTGWLVIDLDATLVTASSDKEGAAPTWKMGYGFHPLGAWLANTRECLAMLLRPGNAGSNTFTDHKEVLAAAIRQVPSRFRRKILVRVDGAGASHDLIKHLLSLSSPRRDVLFTCGWMITAADEDAIRQVPAGAWKPGTGQVLAAMLSAHRSAALDVHVLAGLAGDAVAFAGSGFAVAGVVEEAGERVDDVEQERVDLGLLAGGVLGAVAGGEMVPSGGGLLLVLGGLVSGLVSGPPPAQCLSAGHGLAGGVPPVSLW
jgi:hypothetical protein